jgi:PAS domain S-box-containing protein
MTAVTTPGDPISGVEAAPTVDDLRLLADAVPHLVWVAAPDGSTEYVNHWTTEYTGQSAAANYDWRWLAMVHPDDVDRARAAWARAIETETPYEVEYRLRRADGQFRWHAFRSMPVRGSDGRIVKWVGTATDVQDQKVLEEMLRRSERETAATLTLLETLQTAAPVGLGFIDREFRYLRANDALAAMVDLKADQLLGRTVSEIMPAVWPRLEGNHRRVLDTGEAVLGVEVNGTTAADPGLLHSWLASYYPVRVDAEIIGVGLVVVDLTDRTEAEAFRSIVMDNMAEGLCTVDEAGRLTSMNRAASQMLGWREDELRGKPLHDVVHRHGADGRPIAAAECAAFRALIDRRPILAEDQVFTRKDGSTFPVSYSLTPLNIGSQTGAVLVFRDSSAERERLRRELEARHDQKLEWLGRLSAGIAHEINTPIQFVGDNTRFLAEAYQEMLDLLLVYRDCMDTGNGEIDWDERVKRAAEAERAADIDYLTSEIPLAISQSLDGVERVASLVRAMKSFSYKDSKDRSYADLNEALQTTLTVARNEVKYVADVVLDLGELPEVLCRIGDLNQVFLNLVVNAADAMEGKEGRGEIRVSTGVEGPMAVISVADNGCGIPEHLQQMIFEQFFTTKEVGKGTGQGLALARAVVVDGHGGTIEVHSTPGESTEFVLRLPIDGKKPDPA